MKVYSAGELVPPFGVFDAVSSDTADLYHSAEFYWGGKSRAYPFFASVPFGMTAEEFNSWSNPIHFHSNTSLSKSTKKNIS